MEMNISSYEANNDQQPDPRIIITNFFGTWIQTTLTSRPEIIHQWIHHYWQVYGMLFGNRLIVGAGVQWRPSNHRADTLQLCIGTRCLLIQLSHTPYIPDILRWFLVDVNIHFVGIRNRFDAERLRISDHELLISNLINIGDFIDIGLPGLRGDPSVGRSNWSAEHLTIDQVQYAVVDAYVSFELGRTERIWEVLNFLRIY
ncbi:uncharacterized protein LOC113336632 [Papaver somniferum]|uniref:uncharacterized protein LOC113336632 n=1 Tax=Papaver somniferum TaxID=3469 RepID=UPI000E6F6E32|nr:uncharacterized protein LOC113336632 [Papaver somniferum]